MPQDPAPRARAFLAIGRHLLAMLLAMLVTLAAADGRAATADPPLGRLSDDVSPTAYRLSLTIDPSAERFSGTARIAVRIGRPVAAFWMHGRDLDVERVRVELPDGSSLPARYEQVTDSGVVRLTLDRPLAPGPAELVFDYTAAFADNRRGLYRDRFDGEAYAFTQFEPLSARQAFPGFDEPRFKTPFSVDLTVKTTDIPITNGPARAESADAEGWKTVTFAETAPLPTYLVAFAVGPFDVVEGPDLAANEIRDHPVPLRAIAARGRGPAMAKALASTPTMIAYLERYFGSPYPFQKLDLVAVTSFGSWGMENAGAIFYRQSKILFDGPGSIDQQRDFLGLHAHELAHNWFGNLVTPRWWDDLWLNEAFATWMADKLTHALHPDLFNGRGPLRGARWAMWTDRMANARQIRQPVNDHHDVSDAFDSITYSKGGGVLAMLERYLGPDPFRAGVRDFMTGFAGGSATAEDFFAALSAQSGDPGVLSAFRSFVEQPGIPAVEVELSCEAGARVRLRQSRMVPLGAPAPGDQRWSIPLCLAHGHGSGRREMCLLLDQIDQSLALNAEDCPAWLSANVDGATYMTAFHSDRGWQGLIDNWSALSPAEALTVMSDGWVAYQAGTISTRRLLQLAKMAARSPHWDVARSPMQALRELKLFVVPEPLVPRLKAIMRELYRPALARFDLSEQGLRSDPPSTDLTLLRSELVWFQAFDADDPVLRQRLAGMATDYLNLNTGETDAAALHPDLVGAGIYALATEADPATFEAVLEQFKTTTNPTLGEQLLIAVAYQTAPEKVARILAMVLADEELPGWKAGEVLRYMARRVANREAVGGFVERHLDALETRLGRRQMAWLPWRFSGFCDPTGLDRVQALFAGRIAQYTGGPRSLASVSEKIELCAALVERHRAEAAQAVEAFAVN